MSSLSANDGSEPRIAESRKAGYCLCLVPMRAMVDSRGIKCAFCGQEITDESPPYNNMRGLGEPPQLQEDQHV